MPVGEGYKVQPWVMYDSVAAMSFLIGDSSLLGLAIGTQNPAINSNGEMIFFGVGGRDKASQPNYTNMDASLLSVGLQIDKIGVEIAFPLMEPIHNIGFDPDLLVGVNGPTKLAECIINHSILTLDCGQEEQMFWPLTTIGSGGGLWISSNVAAMLVQNGPPNVDHAMKLPEPISIERTQVLKAKIRIAPDVRDMIGSVTNPGVGAPLATYQYYPTAPTGQNEPVPVYLHQPPYRITVKLWSRRHKKLEYGNIPPTATTK